MSSRRSFIAWLPAFLGGVAIMPRLVEAAESEPPPIPTTARSRFNRAFTARVEACCRQQGNTLEDLDREVGEIIGQRIRPERLIPMCCEELVDQEPLRLSGIYLAHLVAIQLDVPEGWLMFGEATATHPAPEWWVGAS